MTWRPHVIRALSRSYIESGGEVAVPGEVASAYVSLLPSARGFGSKLDGAIGPDIDRSGKRSGSRFGSLYASSALSPLKALGAAAVGLFAVDKTVGFFKDAVAEARESQKVNALTASTIKATGAAANVSAKQVGNLAGAISLKTGIDDETIQSGANMLLTFKNIRNEVGKGNDIFNQSTKTLVDLSAAMGTEPKQAAIQLGKALNDPIKGVTALSRVGVTFNDQQKDQIKTLVTSGKTAQAQKIILKELSSEFGGAAAAQATAGDKFATAFGNLKESVGTALLPVIDKVLGGLTKLAIYVGNNIGPAFSAIGKFVSPAVAAIGGFFSSLSSGGGKSSGLLDSFKGIASAVQANFLPTLKTAGQAFTTQVLPAISKFAQYVGKTLGPVFAGIGRVVAAVIPVIAQLAQFFYSRILPVIVQVASAVGARLKPVFDTLASTFRAQILPAIVQLVGKFREWMPTIQAVVLVVARIVGALVVFAAAVIGKVLPVVIRLAGFIIRVLVRAFIIVVGAIIGVVKVIAAVVGAFGRAIGAAVKLGTGIVRAIKGGLSNLAGLAKAAFAAFVGAIATKAAAAANAAGKIISKIKNVFSGLTGALTSIGGQIIGGLIRGISAGAGKVASVVKSIVDKIPAAVRKIMGIASPSRVMHQLGVYTGQGFTNGLAASLGEASGALNQLQVSGVSAGSLADFSLPSTATGRGSMPAVFNLYDADGDLLGSMQGIADDRVYAAQALEGQV